MARFPLAYHITFGTYGTRLHGDSRGTVTRERNEFGTPVFGENKIVQRVSREQLKYLPVVLGSPQRTEIELAVPEVCERGGWTYHVAAAQPDHVHCILSAQVEGKRVRNWLKRWLGERLSEHWPTEPGQTWRAEGGSVKWIYDEAYFQAAVNYVRRQRFTPEGRV